MQLLIGFDSPSVDGASKEVLLDIVFSDLQVVFTPQAAFVY